MPGGKLSREDVKAWLQYVRGVDPSRKVSASRPTNRVESSSDPSPPPGARKTAQPKRPVRAPAPRRLEVKLRRKLARGTAEIESVLDLHGLSEAQAYRAVQGFIASRQEAGVRLLLIITGKGAGEARGVLRRQVPIWLRSTSLSGRIAAVDEASPRHGGAGAIYVLLRRLDAPTP